MFQDVRFAWRRLRRRPAVFMVSVLALASSVGAAAATWSLISTVLLRPADISSPESFLVAGIGSRTNPAAPPRLETVYSLHRLLAETGAFDMASGGSWPVYAGSDGPLEPRQGYFVTAGFFELLGVAPLRGRVFTAADDRRGAPPVVMVSERFWKRHLAGVEDVLTRSLAIGSHRVPIVGIVPRQFRGLDRTNVPDLYFPLHVVEAVSTAVNPLELPGQDAPSSWIRNVIRLRPEQSLEASFAQVPKVRSRNGDMVAVPWVGVPLADVVLGGQTRDQVASFARLLAGTIALLVVLGSVAVGVLLLGGVEARREEMAVSLALGASKWRLARSVMAEGAILAGAGALLALPAAQAMFDMARTYQLPGGVGLAGLDLQLDSTAAASAGVAAVAATALICLVAVGAAMATRAGDVLVVRAGGGGRRVARATRTAAVVIQVATTLVLLAGGGVFLRSLSEVLRLNPGFDAGRLIDTDINLFQFGYTGDRARDFQVRLLEKLHQAPTTASAAVYSWKGAMTVNGQLPIDGQPRQFPNTVAYIDIDERFFSTSGLRVTTGRDFNASDRAGAPLVAIVTESMARELTAMTGHAVGARIMTSSGQFEVVGVVPDLITSVRQLQPLAIYYPIAQGTPPFRVTVRTRTSSGNAAVISEIRSALRMLDPALTTPPMLTVEARLLDQMRPQQLGLFVLGGLGVLAVILTGLSVYVTSESLAWGRRREMAIRSALGATRRDVSRLMLGTTLRLVGAGLVVGLGLAWFGSKMVAAFLFRTNAFDPLTLALVAVLLLAVACAAALPSIRTAASGRPVDVLREA